MPKDNQNVSLKPLLNLLSDVEVLRPHFAHSELVVTCLPDSDRSGQSRSGIDWRSGSMYPVRVRHTDVRSRLESPENAGLSPVIRRRDRLDHRAG
jgi:hypothetical protein